MKKKIVLACTIVLAACNNDNKNAEEIQRARELTLDSVNMANSRQRTMDSLSAISHSVPDAVVLETPTIQPEPEHGKTRNHPSTNPKKNPPVVTNTTSPS